MAERDIILQAEHIFRTFSIKSGKNPQGNIIDRPTKHIRVFDCQSLYGHGICIGSEMSGGVEDVQIWDCDLANSLSGIEIKATPKRGGYVRGRKMLSFLVCCIALAISATYELIEWGAALALGQGADEFLGTQGDPWDTQSDMFCALLGALSTLLLFARGHDRALRRLPGGLRGR